MKCFFAKTLRFFSFYFFFVILMINCIFLHERQEKNFEIGVVFCEFLTHCWFWMTDKLKNVGILYTSLLLSFFRLFHTHFFTDFHQHEEIRDWFFRCLLSPAHCVFWKRDSNRRVSAIGFFLFFVFRVFVFGLSFCCNGLFLRRFAFLSFSC